MLVHDHEVLTSQVEHVAALVNGLLQKSFEPATIREELMQQVELLKDQLLEHFGFEEEAAFPFLMKAMPNDASRLQAMSVDHDRIARHLVEVAELLRLTGKQTLQLQAGPIAATFEQFLNYYRSHVHEEFEILSAMQCNLTDEQRRELSAIAERLV